MGNKASSLFGTGSQTASSEESSSRSGSGGSTPGTVQSAEERAEAERYSALFGGKPKTRAASKKIQSGRAFGGPTADFDAMEPRPTRSTASSKKKTAPGRKKKKRRPDGGGSKAENQEDAEDGGSGEETADDGGESAPVSPFRGKAAWVNNGAAEKECVTMTEDERQQMLVDSVAAKIMDLEKEKPQQGVWAEGAGEGAMASGKKGEVSQQAMITTNAGITEASRTRAAVTNALFAGAEPSVTSSKELLLNAGGAGLLEGVAGAGLGGVAALPARHINPRPTPQRNFKLKV